MQLQECQYSVCKSCNQRVKRIREEVYGCDHCKKEIDMNEPQREYLEATVFMRNDQTYQMQFCSWKCCLTKLKTVKSDYFISLPYLHYGDSNILAKDFFKLVKV